MITRHSRVTLSQQVGHWQVSCVYFIKMGGFWSLSVKMCFSCCPTFFWILMNITCDSNYTAAPGRANLPLHTVDTVSGQQQQEVKLPSLHRQQQHTEIVLLKSNHLCCSTIGLPSPTSHTFKAFCFKSALNWVKKKIKFKHNFFSLHHLGTNKISSAASPFPPATGGTRPPLWEPLLCAFYLSTLLS